MSAKEVIRDYLPCIMLGGFGVTLTYVGLIVSIISVTYCPPLGPASQCIDVAAQNQIETISAWLFYSGLFLIAASVAVAFVTRWLRIRAVRRRTAPMSTSGGRSLAGSTEASPKSGLSGVEVKRGKSGP